MYTQDIFSAIFNMVQLDMLPFLVRLLQVVSPPLHPVQRNTCVNGYTHTHTHTHRQGVYNIFGCGRSSHLGDLHDLDGRQLPRLDVPALVDLTVGAITHHLYQLKYSSRVLGVSA